jgi:hypothetical protein
MRRHDFMTVLSGATVAWPLALRAQQRGVPVVGYVSAGTEAEQAPFVALLRRTLSEGDFIEGWLLRPLLHA